MSTTYYTSLSGMLAASYGLQNASNNVANMKSTGFKRSDVFYSSLGNEGGQNGLKSGVYIGGQSTNFAQGNYQETGNPSDLAVVGNGFFIVKLDNGEFLYTRDGEFGFNNDGLLIDKHSQGLVQGYDKHGGLVPISQFGSKVNPGKATHFMDVKGEFIISEIENPELYASHYARNKFTVTVFDDSGKPHEVTLEFESEHTPVPDDKTNNFHDELKWTLVEQSCSTATIDFELGQSIQFGYEDSGPEKESGKIKFTLNGTQHVTLNFGDIYSGEDASVYLRRHKTNEDLHSKTLIEEIKQDGYHFGKQTGFEFDSNGQITYSYDNEKNEEGLFVALALFDDLDHTLTHAQDNLFRAKHTDGLKIGRPNKENFGTIEPKKLESSNVDPTTEFANIVILQRMFQACSQIMDIDKQLLEELYKK